MSNPHLTLNGVAYEILDLHMEVVDYPHTCVHGYVDHDAHLGREALAIRGHIVPAYKPRTPALVLQPTPKILFETKR